jgi:hypothetical protein
MLPKRLRRRWTDGVKESVMGILVEIGYAGILAAAGGSACAVFAALVLHG